MGTSTKSVLTVADSHFDERNRFDECIAMHDKILEDVHALAAKGEAPDLFVHTGDVFERPSTVRERLAVRRWVMGMLEVMPGVVTRGNHDSPLDLETLLGKLRTKHPVVVEERAGVHEIAGIQVCGLAWPRMGDILAHHRRSGAEAPSRVETAQYAQELLRGVLRGFSASPFDGPRILAAHALVDGSKTSSGQPLVAADMNVSLDELMLAQADLVLLGHIHLGQDWEIDGVPIVFPGSPRPTDHAEIEPKGYVLAKLREDPSAPWRGREARWSATWRRVILPTTPLVHVEGRYMPEADQIFLTSTEGTGLPVGGDLKLLVLDPNTVGSVLGADVRLRYEFDVDRREAAKRAAEVLRAQWLAAGAKIVRFDPKPLTVVRARAPEVAAARTLDAKLEAYWTARQIEIPSERKADVLLLARQLEEEVGRLSTGSALPGLIRCESVKMRGIGPFREETFVDFAKLQGPIVAVCGENGAGKTTLLESAFSGAMYRKMPTRGPIVSMATSRDSFIESVIVNGARSVLRHTLDKVSGDGECFIQNEDGTSALKSALKGEFDDWVRAHLPSAPVFHCAQFAVQGKEGFIGLTEGARTGIVLRVIGCEHLEALAKAAGAHATKTKAALALCEARLQDEIARGGDIPGAEQDLGEAKTAHEKALAEKTAADAALDEAGTALAAWREASLKAEHDRAKRADLTKRLAEVNEELCALEGKTFARRDILNLAVRVEPAITEEAVLAAAAEKLEAARAGAAEAKRDAIKDRDVATTRLEESRAQRAREHETKMREASSRLGEATSRHEALKVRKFDLDKLLASAADVRAAKEELPGAEEKVAALHKTTVELVDAEKKAFDEGAQFNAQETARIQAIADAERALARMQPRLCLPGGVNSNVATNREEIASAIRDLPGAIQAAHAAFEAHRSMCAQVRELEAKRLSTKDDRIVDLRAGLASIVADPNVEASARAGAALLRDDRALNAATDIPARIEAGRVAIEDLRAAFESASAWQRSLETTVAAEPSLEAAIAESQEWIAKRAEAVGDPEARKAEIARLNAAHHDAIARHTKARAEWVDAKERAARLIREAASYDQVLVADAQLVEVVAQLEEASRVVEALKKERDACAAPIAERTDVEQACEATIASAKERLQDAEFALFDAMTALDANRARRAELAPLVALGPRLPEARAQLDEIESRTEKLLAAGVEVFEALNEIPVDEPADLSPHTRIEMIRAAVVDAANRLERAAITVASAERDLARAVEVAAKVLALQSERKVLVVVLSNWTRLHEDLGRDGIQALEVDAAAPELTETVNHLLGKCHGSRFVVEVRASRLKSRGTEEIEGFEAMVLDNGTEDTAPRLGEARTFSGGERSFLNEAFANGLLLLGSRRISAKGATLARDESAAALSPGMAEAYVRMLRLVVEETGCEKILFVSHDPHSRALADSQLWIEGGRISVP